MTARSRLVCILAAALALALPACTNFTAWIPVDGGAEADADHAVDVEGVLVQVANFGVLDGWGKPTAELKLLNGGTATATFDVAKVRLQVEDDHLAPTLEAGQSSEITLRPGESFDTQLTFDTTLPIRVRDDTNRDDMKVLTPEMFLHLGPLYIDGTEHALPALAYRNPDP